LKPFTPPSQVGPEIIAGWLRHFFAALRAAYSVDELLTAELGADHPEMAALAADIGRFSADYGVELDFAGRMDMTETLNLVFVPREFQPTGDSFDDRFRFLGPMLGNREQAEPWSPPDPVTPVLFISLGTIFTDHPEFYRTCIEAFADGSWQVAMTVGDMDPAALGPLPPTVDVRPRFPQAAVLRRGRCPSRSPTPTGSRSSSLENGWTPRP
jgi:MGT family glycosyltransferase